MGSEEGDAGRKIMLLAILSLFVVVIVILILHIYTKFLLNRRQRRRTRDLQRLRWRLAEGGDAHTHSQPQKSGLDPSVIAALPAFSYVGGGDEAIDCAVCLGAVVEGAAVRVLPNCKHLFHVECVDMWLGSHTTCPICRAGVEAVIGPGGGAAAGEMMMGRGSGAGAQPSAPPLEREVVMGGGGAQLEKGGVSSSSSRLDSFRRIFGRSGGGGDEIGATEDVERQ